MLHYIRDRAQGWVAWFIVGLISIPFALWGLNSYVTGPSDQVVAEVNGEEIQQSEMQRSIRQYRDQMRNMLGDEYNPEQFQGSQIRNDILDQLIEQRLLTSASDNIGQQAPDGYVAEYIRQTPAFQVDGEFDSEQYNMVLARAGYSPGQYESQLRNDLLTQELTQNIQESAIVSKTELNRMLRLEGQTRELAYGVIPAADFVDRDAVSEEAARDFYRANEAQYTAPEQIAIEYLELSRETLAEQLDPDEQALRDYYEQNENQFLAPEQRRVSHILIEGDDDDAREQAEALYERLQEGEPFAALAEEYSADSASADEGGDLEYIQRDVMEPAFEEAAFNLEGVGDISEPVKTEFGYHLIKLTDIRDRQGLSFEEARDEVAEIYLEREAERRFYDLADELANLTFENPDSLDVAANTLGLEIKSTEPFSRNGNSRGIASEDKVVEAAFGQDVLEDGLNSEAIELDDTHLVVIRKKEHIPAKLLPFDSVRESIVETLAFQRATEKARETGEALLEDIEDGAEPESVFADYNWQAAQRYERDSDEINGQVLRRAFALPRTDDQALHAGFTAENGNYIVLRMSDVEDADIADADAETRQALATQLQRLNGRAELDAFITHLRESAEIDINERRVDEVEE